MSRVDVLAPARRTQPERRAATRRRLLDAAFACLLDDGSLAMTLADVASRAGLTTGAVQRHFGTKSGLLLAVFDDLNERQLQRVGSIDAPTGGTRRDRLRVALVNTWDGRDLQYARVAAELAQAGHADPILRDALREHDERMRAKWITAFARHVDPALAEHPQFPTTLSAILILIRGLTAPPALLNTEGEIREFLGKVADLLEAGLTAHSDSGATPGPE